MIGSRNSSTTFANRIKNRWCNATRRRCSAASRMRPTGSGLISFDEKQYLAAEEYLKNLTLDIWPRGPWTDWRTLQSGSHV